MVDIDQNTARAIVDDALRAGPEGGLLPADEAARLLAAYGVQVWPTVVVTSLVEAVAGAAEVGYPVALKATAEQLRHRPELGTVRLDISNEDELRTAYEAMAAHLGVASAELAVQAMAPIGVPTVVRTAEDASFGALMSFGVGGVATDLLGDHQRRPGVAQLMEVPVGRGPPAGRSERPGRRGPLASATARGAFA
jgi:acyl-CoA synthetase (NDP forming)